MLLFGALAGTVVVAVHPDDIRDARNGPLHLVYIFTSLLVLLGIQAVPDHLRGRAGAFASAGFLAISVFIVLSEIGHSVLNATVIPILRDNPATTDLIADGSWLDQSLFSGAFGVMLNVGMVGLFVGVLLVGLGTLVEGSYPRWPAVLMLLGASTAVLPLPQGPYGPAVFYLGLAGFGYAAMTGTTRESLPFGLPWRRRAEVQQV
jgi:hypothetical protein